MRLATIASCTPAAASAALLLVVPASTFQPTQERTPAAEGRQESRIDQRAQPVVDRVRAHYGALKNAGFEIVTTTTMQLADKKLESTASLVVSIARPNHVSAHPPGDRAQDYALVCDGSTLWQFFGGQLNKYEEVKAPDTFGGVAEAAQVTELEAPEEPWLQPSLLLLTLLDTERFDALLRRTQRVMYVAPEELAGQRMDHIRIVGTQIDADLWIPAEGDAWIVKVAPDTAKLLGDPGKLTKDMLDQMPRTVSTLKSKVVESLPPGSIVFTPPQDAQRVPSLAAAVRRHFSGAQEAVRHDELLGKPAPKVELDLMSGEKASLESHIGKHVVVLDFWASWCPPCVRALPIVAGAAASFKDQGVVFYAVNEQERPEAIRDFLEKRAHQFSVALDSTGAVGRAFGVTGIPQTILIGRDGTVQAIHVGFLQNTETQLVEQLGALIENEAIVKNGNADR